MVERRQKSDNRVHRSGRPNPMDDVTTLIARIDSLLESPSEADNEDVRAHMEVTLTDGYAAEHGRLQRRIGAIAAELAEGRRRAHTKELAALARRLAAAEQELEALRETLASLRDRIALAAHAA